MSIDIADRNGVALRWVLASAERFNEAAIAFGSSSVKTAGSSASAALCSVTSWDQRRLDLRAAITTFPASFKPSTADGAGPFRTCG